MIIPFILLLRRKRQKKKKRRRVGRLALLCASIYCREGGVLRLSTNTYRTCYVRVTAILFNYLASCSVRSAMNAFFGCTSMICFSSCTRVGGGDMNDTSGTVRYQMRSWRSDNRRRWPDEISARRIHKPNKMFAPLWLPIYVSLHLNSFKRCEQYWHFLQRCVGQRHGRVSYKGVRCVYGPWDISARICFVLCFVSFLLLVFVLLRCLECF